MMKVPIYGYMRVSEDEDQARKDEQTIRDFIQANNLVLIGMFYEAQPRRPRAAFKDLAALLMDRNRRQHVVIPSMRHLDEAGEHAGNLRLGFEVITGVKVIDASRPEGL